MKYYFEENFKLLYADGTLYDENHLPVYTYENQTLFLPQIDLFKYGQKIGHVKKNWTFFLRNYDIVLDNEVVDSLQQQFTFFSQELTLERLGWTVRGDWLALDYQIYDESDELICEVSQELFRLTRHYQINVIDESREELIILLVLAINQYDKDHASSGSAHHSSHH